MTRCTTTDCPRHATKIVAWPMTTGSMYVGAYCDEHGSDIEVDQGGVPAVGSAVIALTGEDLD